MESNQQKRNDAQPLDMLVAHDAISECERLESEFRDKGDYCHNNIGCKTFEDWERMDKFLIGAADIICRIREGVKLLTTVNSRKKLRNCDVGTAEEQAERFENFCLKHIGCAEETGGRHCVGCPLEKASRNTTQKCELYWAQMPYEKEEIAN